LRHTEFVFGYEGMLHKSNIDSNQVPPGALISFIQKGLQYLELEANLNNVRPVSLLALVRTRPPASNTSRVLGNSVPACMARLSLASVRHAVGRKQQPPVKGERPRRCVEQRAHRLLLLLSPPC